MTLRPILATDRLELRPMTLDHLPLLHQLDSDPEVMRHLLGRARTSDEIDAFWAPRCSDVVAAAVGLGWWVGFEDDAFVGWWDLGRSDSEPSAPPHPRQAEIGWRVVRRCWRRGLATEGAQALLRHGFSSVGLERVWASTATANLASRGVMEKLGMRHVADDDSEVTYEITATAWQARAAG